MARAREVKFSHSSSPPHGLQVTSSAHIPRLQHPLLFCANVDIRMNAGGLCMQAREDRNLAQQYNLKNCYLSFSFSDLFLGGRRMKRTCWHIKNKIRAGNVAQ
jgi:hypothetical protein